MNVIQKHREFRGWLTLVIAGVTAILALGSLANASNPPTVAISNVPLVLVQPTQPQILFILANSQSIDGDLSGAIMTGSGTVSAFAGSSSPVNYRVPAGFIPPCSMSGAPCSAPVTGGIAPYTVSQNGTLYDNSASRLNVAKEAMMEVITNYAASFSIGLMNYNTGTGNVSPYTTWLYLMSGTGGFIFGDNGNVPPVGTRWIANSCYQSSTGYCASIAGVLGSSATNQPLMAIAASSDDADINDVLYASGGFQPAFLDYGTPLYGHRSGVGWRPLTSPYTFYSLNDYNNGNIVVRYPHCTPGSCVRETSPTNAGYVPYSPQVLYAQRGFGFYATAASNSGNLILPISPASCASGGSTSCSNPATPAQIRTYISKFAPYLAPETNGSKTASKSTKTDIKALAVQSPIAGPLKSALTYFTSGIQGFPKPPSNTGCKATQYVVLITDGLPTEDLSGKNWPPLGTQSANGYGVHATFNLKGGGTVADTDPNFTNDVVRGLTTTVASTNDQALVDTLSQIAALKNKQIQTYIIGMGGGVDPTKNPTAAATMKAMALAGGTNDYFPAVTPQDVVNDMQVIFGQIQAANMSTTTVAVNSTSYQSNQAVYQARFDTASFGWTGDLVAFPLLSNGTVDQNPNHELWDARTLMQSKYAGTGWDTKRVMATWNPAANSGAGTGTPFRWSGLTATQQSELEVHWNTLTASQQSAFGNSQSNYGKAVLDYLRGDQADTQAHNDPFRNRSYLMGDVVNSAPLYVAAPNGVYPGTSYATFAQSNVNRTPVLYVGANDGMLHAFNAVTGQEIFDYLPAGPFSKLADLSEPAYDSNHEYFVDGSPNAGDVQFIDGSWHTIVVGGLNAGGEGIYALDVTDPSTLTSESAVASHVLWDITSATPGFGHLGLTYSQPQIAQIDCNGTNCNNSGNTFVVIFGSGYNNDNGNPYLYVVNAETGALIKAFDLCSYVSKTYCKNNEPNGLSTPVVVSNTGSTVSDRVYAGDLQSNLWRVDFSDPSPANWSAIILMKAQGPAGKDQPITTKPVASFAPPAAGGGIVVYFGTGEYLGQPNVTDTNVQDFYGVLDRNTTTRLPLTRANLNSITLSNTTVKGVTVRTATGSAINWSSERGWLMDLPASGERVITNPRLIGGRVVFTTFTPSSAACSAGGSSWLMIVNYATGGQLPGPELDLNGDSKLNSSDQTSTGANPVGLSLGPGYAAAPTIVSYHRGPFNDLKLITVSGAPIKSIKERGEPRGVLSWSEIR